MGEEKARLPARRFVGEALREAENIVPGEILTCRKEP